MDLCLCFLKKFPPYSWLLLNVLISPRAPLWASSWPWESYLLIPHELVASTSLGPQFPEVFPTQGAHHGPLCLPSVWDPNCGTSPSLYAEAGDTHNPQGSSPADKNIANKFYIVPSVPRVRTRNWATPPNMLCWDKWEWNDHDISYDSGFFLVEHFLCCYRSLTGFQSSYALVTCHFQFLGGQLAEVSPDPFLGMTPRT